MPTPPRIFPLSLSSLTEWTKMPGTSYAGPLPALGAREMRTEECCRKHVAVLCNTIGERHIGAPLSLDRTATYVEEQLTALGYQVTPHAFDVGGVSMRNVVGHLPNSETDSKTIVVGAHYDSVPGSVGANDNGTGIAALLELARLIREKPIAASVRFVAFANEEHVGLPPETMGSYLYAKACRERGEAIALMVSLETLGYFTNHPSTQRFPPPFEAMYPPIGNFVAFVSSSRYKEELSNLVAVFRERAKFPSEGLAAPEIFEDVGRSDHWGFWQAGYPALMITDTAPFRYPHYHAHEDTPDKVCFPELARVIHGLAATLEALLTR